LCCKSCIMSLWFWFWFWSFCTSDFDFDFKSLSWEWFWFLIRNNFISDLSQHCLQLWQSYAILSATTIMCSKCPPSIETHAGWSHLIWHNFFPVGDNWIKICILPYIWTFNRRVKFGLKIPNRLGKMSENASVRFGRRWTFCTHDVNWVVTLNMA